MRNQDDPKVRPIDVAVAGLERNQRRIRELINHTTHQGRIFLLSCFFDKARGVRPPRQTPPSTNGERFVVERDNTDLGCTWTLAIEDASPGDLWQSDFIVSRSDRRAARHPQAAAQATRPSRARPSR